MSGSETELDELDELDDWYQMGCWATDFVPPCFDENKSAWNRRAGKEER